MQLVRLALEFWILTVAVAIQQLIFLLLVNVLRSVLLGISQMIPIKNVKSVIKDVLNVMVLNPLNVLHVRMDTIYIKTLVKLVVQMNTLKMVMFVQIVINSALIVLERNQINVLLVLLISISIQIKILVILNVLLDHSLILPHSNVKIVTHHV